MKAIAAYIFMFSLVIIYNQDIGDFCTSKSISNRINDNDNFAQDVTLAHHEVASCASLNAYSEDDISEIKQCCYVKLKYKLEGEKYTRKGCQIIDSTENIDTQIDDFENSFQNRIISYYSGLGNSDVEIKDVEASIDCNSNFIKYSVLLILLILF